jgi:hypothetical protein
MRRLQNTSEIDSRACASSFVFISGSADSASARLADPPARGSGVDQSIGFRKAGRSKGENPMGLGGWDREIRRAETISLGGKNIFGDEKV